MRGGASAVCKMRNAECGVRNGERQVGPTGMIAPMSALPGDERTGAPAGGVGEQVVHAVARATAAGLPLAQALDAYARENPSRRAGRALRTLSRSLESGLPLEQAVREVQPPLPEYVAALVQAAANSGHLALVLEQHLTAARRARDLRVRFWMSAAYPLVLLAASVAILFLMLTVFVPTMSVIFVDFGIPLPAMTKLTIGISDALVATLPWWPYGVTLLVLLALGVHCIRYLPGRAARTRLWQRVPLYGSAARSVALAEFCGCLSLLIDCRVPLPKALRLTSATLRDPNLAEGSRRLAEQCEQGLPPDQEVAYLPHFPDALVPLFRWEGRPAAFSNGLRAAAELYAAQSQVRTWIAGSFIQPIVLGIIVFTVGGIMVTVFLPLFALLRALT